MKLSEFASQLSDLVEKAIAEFPADDVRDTLQTELDNVEDDEEEEDSEEEESKEEDTK